MRERKVAIVVGGAGRIGRAVVVDLLRAGCAVAVVSYRNHSIEEILDWRDEYESNISILKADMSDERQVQLCLKKVKKHFGGIDYLVYSAGIAPDTETPLLEYSELDWQRTFDVYVKGFFLCFREAMKIMEGKGHVVAVSSAITRFPTDMLPPIYAGPYAASKAALDELVRWGRREAHEKNILLSRFAPGAVDTPFHQDAPKFRKPAALLPLQLIATKITEALINEQETDLQIVAEPKQSLPSATTAITLGADRVGVLQTEAGT